MSRTQDNGTTHETHHTEFILTTDKITSNWSLRNATLYERTTSNSERSFPEVPWMDDANDGPLWCQIFKSVGVQENAFFSKNLLPLPQNCLTVVNPSDGMQKFQFSSHLHQLFVSITSVSCCGHLSVAIWRTLAVEGGELWRCCQKFTKERRARALCMGAHERPHGSHQHSAFPFGVSRKGERPKSFFPSPCCFHGAYHCTLYMMMTSQR